MYPNCLKECLLMEDIMIEWLVHMWQGYLRVVLTGIAPERFFNMCRVQEIELWNIKKEQDAYVCCMTVRGLKRSKPLLKKAKVRLRIKEKFGLPFFLYRNRKRKLTVLGMLLFVVILYGMTWFIWDISFLGNTHYTDEMLLTYLNQQEIRYGMIKYQISCEELEEKIRLDFSDITWVSARVSGTRLIIQVKENEVLTQNEDVSNDSPCNLTAQKDGVIVSMVVRSGIPKVKVGDVGEKGQILVEGRVPLLNDAKEEVRSQFLRADAEVFAECELFYEDCFPMLHEERSLTGKERKGWYLQVLDESFVWLLPKKKDTSWNVVTQVYPVSIWENFVLPISWGRIDAKEYVG